MSGLCLYFVIDHNTNSGGSERAMKFRVIPLMISLFIVGGCDAKLGNESLQAAELKPSKGDNDNVCDLIGEEGVSFGVDVINAFGEKYDISDLMFEDGESFVSLFSEIDNERLSFVIKGKNAKTDLVFIEYVQKQSRDLRQKNYVDHYMTAMTAETLGNESLVLRYCDSSQQCEKFPKRPVLNYEGYWQKDADNKISRTVCFISAYSTKHLIGQTALRDAIIESSKFHYADCFFRAMGVRGQLRDLSELSNYENFSTAYVRKFRELSLQGYSNKIESILSECEGG